MCDNGGGIARLRALVAVGFSPASYGRRSPQAQKPQLGPTRQYNVDSNGTFASARNPLCNLTLRS